MGSVPFPDLEISSTATNMAQIYREKTNQANETDKLNSNRKSMHLSYVTDIFNVNEL